MIRHIVLAIIGLSFFTTHLAGQRLDHRLGYIIIQMAPDHSLEALIDRQAASAGGEIRIDRTISTRLGLYLLHFDFRSIAEDRLLAALKADPAVIEAQYDHLPALRTIPDDPRFDAQWQWLNTGQTGGQDDADIDAEEAWNYTQGGVTALGDTIVVAIIDDGLDFNHEDIAANVWRNHGEIEGNGIDDDGNGYTDDVYGWNAYDNTPNVFGNNHGLNVAGMVGAVGNNQTGVTGVNWHVKLMTIVGGTPESAALASYAYALEQRIRYNETNGAAGAFVVATNSSWGIDFGQPADAPLWCAFYDSLGVHGILSAAATSNLGIDIDLAGDLPTACPSDYLLSVTALNHNNDRTFSAWGITQVDFGAPGENIFTTRRNNGYGTTSGTSFASPVAAGLVALLYAAPCQGLAQLARNNPASAALYIRDLIFQGIEPVGSLNGFVRLGGGLNAGNSMELLMSLCADCPTPFDVDARALSASEVSITWSTLDEPDSLNVRFRPLGSTAWDTLAGVDQPLLISGLSGCTTYEIEFEAVCDSISNGFNVRHEFITDGCCELPTDLQVTPGEAQLQLTWDDVLAAERYTLQWRPAGTLGWFEETAFMPGYTLEELDPCTFYELRLQTDCDTSVTGFTDILTVRTRGCGNCIDLAYCAAISADASEEIIDSLLIGPIVNPSGPNGGYAFFENAGIFVAGDSYSVWLKPGFPSGESFDEHFRVWIDINQDGTFSNEEIFVDSVLTSGNIELATEFVLPDSTAPGSTRMRVIMAYADPFNPQVPQACGQIEYGEIEDYCLQILQRPDECPVVDTVQFDAVTYTSAYMYWPGLGDAIAYTYRYREVGTTEYTEFATVDTTALLMDLDKCKTYEVQIMTVCAADTAGYITQYLLATDCDVAVNEVPAWAGNVAISPNPTANEIALRFEALSAGQYDLEIFNTQGFLLASHTLALQPGETGCWHQNDLTRYPPGLYFLAIAHHGQRIIKKFVKI